jgi:uncharacterized protein (TIGR03000 family)
MYSVVLMMAMTTGAETPDLGRRNGCCGCMGSSHGHRSHGCRGGCHGGYGGCYGGATSGCYGGTGCYGGVKMMPPAKKPEEITKPPKKDEAMAPAPARIIVSLPADAKLTFDGASTTSTSTERVFVSPDLEPNRDFRYTLRAEVLRDGKPMSVEQTVAVRAGMESRVIMNLPVGVATR